MNDPGDGDDGKPFIRPLRESDIDSVLEMMRGYYAEDGYPFDETVSRSTIRRFLDDPSIGRLWVFDDGGTAVGYFALTLGYSLEYQGRDAFLDELFLRYEFRGAALGARALETVISAARDLEVRALHLEVERDRPKVIDLYRRSGFVDNDRCLVTLRLSDALAG